MTDSTSLSSICFSGSFPPEIMDEISDKIDDTPTLKACTLVCHDWLARARTNLFRIFTFPLSMPASDCVEFVEPLAKFESLVADMKSSRLSPSLSVIVRHLIVKFSGFDKSHDHPAAVQVVSQLPFDNLQSLVFEGWLTLKSSSSFEWPLLEKNPLLEQFTMTSLSCPTATFLQLCSKLAATQSALRCVTLDPIILRTWDVSFDISLPLTEHYPRLRSLSISAWHDGDTETSGPRTSFLGKRPGTVLGNLQPFRLPKLVDLELRIPTENYAPTLAKLRDALTVLPNLAHLSLEMRYNPNGEGLEIFRNYFLREIDDLLTNSDTANFERLTLRLPTLSDWHKIPNEDETLRQSLPRTNRRGWLDVKWY
ncbi:hypothetical protein D9758_013088 [Tetrapyrgos nigripes]|uniref:Uncharacterized protein n=1 Tax=Tetrapyrgos nigripes TaxID=182062 RepID=A0A8H5FIS3_9AGAR|nr:hypothetical protein D9758_013088 [Tetrapyrgos nigripes]